MLFSPPVLRPCFFSNHQRPSSICCLVTLFSTDISSAVVFSSALVIASSWGQNSSSFFLGFAFLLSSLPHLPLVGPQSCSRQVEHQSVDKQRLRAYCVHESLCMSLSWWEYCSKQKRQKLAPCRTHIPKTGTGQQMGRVNIQWLVSAKEKNRIGKEARN